MFVFNFVSDSVPHCSKEKQIHSKYKRARLLLKRKLEETTTVNLPEDDIQSASLLEQGEKAKK